MRIRKIDSQYLANLAQDMIHRFRIPKELGLDGSVAQIVYERFGEAITKRVLAMNPGKRGEIAQLGLGKDYSGPDTTLYQVHCGTWLGKHESGANLVSEIAVTAITAQIADLLTSQVQEPPEYESGHPYGWGHSMENLDPR